jgi:hypothetical protein
MNNHIKNIYNTISSNIIDKCESNDEPKQVVTFANTNNIYEIITEKKYYYFINEYSKHNQDININNLQIVKGPDGDYIVYTSNIHDDENNNDYKNNNLDKCICKCICDGHKRLYNGAYCKCCSCDQAYGYIDKLTVKLNNIWQLNRSDRYSLIYKSNIDYLLLHSDDDDIIEASTWIASQEWHCKNKRYLIANQATKAEHYTRINELKISFASAWLAAILTYKNKGIVITKIDKQQLYKKY